MSSRPTPQAERPPPWSRRPGEGSQPLRRTIECAVGDDERLAVQRPVGARDRERAARLARDPHRLVTAHNVLGHAAGRNDLDARVDLLRGPLGQHDAVRVRQRDHAALHVDSAVDAGGLAERPNLLHRERDEARRPGAGRLDAEERRRDTLRGCELRHGGDAEEPLDCRARVGLDRGAPRGRPRLRPQGASGAVAGDVASEGRRRAAARTRRARVPSPAGAAPVRAQSSSSLVRRRCSARKTRTRYVVSGIPSTSAASRSERSAK